MSRSALSDVSSSLRTKDLDTRNLQNNVEDHEGRVAALEATRTRVLGIPLTAFKGDGTWKDALADAPGSSLIGLADAHGSPLLGNAASANHKTDYAVVAVAIPADYSAGGALTIRIRAKIATSLATVLSTVDLDSVKVAGDTLGSDICETPAQQVTTAYADYDFVITPTGRVAGDILVARLLFDNDDTGGTNNKAMSAVAAQLRYLGTN